MIVADEPTTALDVNVQRVILQTLPNLRRELGIAILVSHDLAVHAELVDRIGDDVRRRGRRVGGVRPVFKEPLHPYTQGLMRSIPAIGGERKRLAGISGTPPARCMAAGCRFHPRCPHEMEVCESVPPMLAELRAGVADLSTRSRIDGRPRPVRRLPSHPESRQGGGVRWTNGTNPAGRSEAKDISIVFGPRNSARSALSRSIGRRWR